MRKLSTIINSIRFFGVQKSLRTIQYAVIRDLAERNSLSGRSIAVQPAAEPGEFRDVHLDDSSVSFQFANYVLEIAVLTPNTFRLTWLPGKLPADYAIDCNRWQPIDYLLEKLIDGHSINTGAFTLQIYSDGGISLLDITNKKLRREYPPRFLQTGWEHTAELNTEAAIYGLGMRAAGLNLRAGEYRIWNTDPGGSYTRGEDPLYLNIPAYTALSPTGSYLVFYENSHDGCFRFDDHALVKYPVGALRYYLIAGPLPQALSDYTKLTGRPPLPPRWSLGYHQSRWGYKDERQIRDLVEKFRLNDLPIDAIHLDIDYMDEYRVFTIDQARFPDLRKLTTDLADQNLRLVTIIDPGVKVDPDYTVYREGIEKDVFVKYPDGTLTKALVWPDWCVFPDFTNPKAREWWASQYQYLVSQGVAGVWHDMNEPGTFSAWGDPTLPKNALHELEGRTGDHREAHNLYGLMMNRAGFEGLQKAFLERRPWLLTRSGWAGVQRYAWNWTADVESSWKMLQQTIPALLNLSLSGIYYAGSDIGGFSGHPDRELYLRWFQLAAFTPFFRLHCATGLPAREPWEFDPQVLEIVRQYLKLRHRLLPYLYTLAYQAQADGVPLMRPMSWESPTRPQVYNIEDQFMLGELMLVAPILYPGADQREVWLPQGEWIDFWTSQVLQGPASVTVKSRIDQIPLFIKAGHILPLEDGEELNLYVYIPTQNLQAHPEQPDRLYSDAGDGYGPSRIDSFQLTCKNDGFSILHTNSGDYEWPYVHMNCFFVNRDFEEISVDGEKIEGPGSKISVEGFRLIQGKLKSA